MKKKYLLILSLLFLLLLAVYLQFTPFGRILVRICYVFFDNDIVRDIFFSIKRVLIGFFLASFTGIGLAVFLGRFKKLGFIRYLLEIMRPIPPIARIPLAILRFGLGDTSSYFIVFIGSFFPIFTNTYFGITSIPQIYLDFSDNVELNTFDFYWKILGIYSLPYIFSGLKIGLGMGWMSLIAAELIGAQSGLGYYIQINRLLLNMNNVVLGMAIIGIVGFGLHYGLGRLEKVLVKWK